MTNKRKPIVIALICVAVLAAAATCAWFFWLNDYFKAANSSPVYVNAVSAITGLNTGVNPRYSGIVEPQQTFKINKDESKTVSEVKVSVGDEVHIGDVLFSYDTQEMQFSLKEAELALEGIANTISTLKTQKTTLENEKKKASKDDQYAYTVKIQSCELQIKNEEYNSSLKKSEIDKLKKDLENAEIISEVEGVVKEVNLTPKTDSTGQQLPFISILSSGEFRVKGTISELNLYSISEGQAVSVHSRVDNNQTWKGQIEKINTEPTSDQNNPGYYYGETGEKSSKYNFYVVLDNLEGLILGQHVYIEPDLGESSQKTGLWLPAVYVDRDSSGSFVWARDEKEKLEKRTIFLGDYDSESDMYEIKSGITTVDFIAYPNDSLLEGMPTTVDASQMQIPDDGSLNGMGGSDFVGSIDNSGGGNTTGDLDTSGDQGDTADSGVIYVDDPDMPSALLEEDSLS